MMAYLTAVFMILAGITAIILRDNLLKKIIGLSVFSNGLHLLIISIGYRTGGIAPIMQGSNAAAFAQAAVDPLPQALVLTSIVINTSVVALALVIAIEVHRHFKTLDMRKVKSLKG